MDSLIAQEVERILESANVGVMARLKGRPRLHGKSVWGVCALPAASSGGQSSPAAGLPGGGHCGEGSQPESVMSRPSITGCTLRVTAAEEGWWVVRGKVWTAPRASGPPSWRLATNFKVWGGWGAFKACQSTEAIEIEPKIGKISHPPPLNLENFSSLLGWTTDIVDCWSDHLWFMRWVM